MMYPSDVLSIHGLDSVPLKKLAPVIQGDADSVNTFAFTSWAWMKTVDISTIAAIS